MKFGRYRVSLVILVGGVLGGLLIVALFALAWQFIDTNKPDIVPTIVDGPSSAKDAPAASGD